MAERVLRDLHEHRVAGLQCHLDSARLAVESRGVPVDLAGVEHCIAAAPDVDEGGLHRWEHVLHAPQVDIADHGRRRSAVDVVLDKDAVFEDSDLRATAALPDDHDPVDGLATGEELGFGQDRGTTPTGVPALAATLPLGLQPHRALQR